ncbi:hypothetical protein C2G38_2107391, partial [Gigaspora rosea]
SENMVLSIFKIRKWIERYQNILELFTLITNYDESVTPQDNTLYRAVLTKTRLMAFFAKMS